MKTQVIQVEAHDDIVSLRDKLSWVKARRVLLVYPRRSVAMDTRLAWLLLRRKAEAMGASLGVVAHSAQARRLAQEADIPVFTSVLEAQQAEWAIVPYRRAKRRTERPDWNRLRAEIRRRERVRLSFPAARLAMFSLAVLALLVLLLFLWPAAEIRLSPVRLMQSLPLDVRAVPEEEQAPSSNDLLLHLTSVVVEGNKTWPASGQISLPVTYAQGSVRFRNLTDTVLAVPAGTVVRSIGSPSVRFITLQDAVVKAGVDSWVDVPVRAELPGTAGNLPADSLVVIDGPLGTSLAATNPQPTHGGSAQRARAPSETDRWLARSALLAELRQRALALLQEQVGVDSILIPETLDVVQILEESSLPAEGQPGDVLLVRLKAEFSAQYLLSEDIRPRAMAVLNTILPGGFVPVEGTLSVQLIDVSALEEEGVLSCRFLLRQDIKRQIDGAHLARLVRGRRAAIASALISSRLPLSASPQIRMKPSWWPWLPFTEFRIDVRW